MPKLPRISGKALVKILTTIGYTEVRQKGSHVRICKGSTCITVPDHPIIGPALFKKILRDAGINNQEYTELFGPKKKKT